MHTIKKSTEALLVANNETLLDVNAEKTTCITMPRDQNSGLINAETLQSFYNSHNTSELHAWKKLTADCSQGKLAIFQFRILCLPVYYAKTYRLKYTEL